MIMTNKLICANFFVLFLSFFIFEILFIVTIIFIYQYQLYSTTEQIPDIITNNSKELLDSFNNFLNEEINNLARDSLLISKHLSMYKQSDPSLGQINPDSLFGTIDDNCLIENITPLQADNAYRKYVEMILVNSAHILNPVFALINTTSVFDTDTDLLSNDDLVSKLFELKSLDKISYYQDPSYTPIPINKKEICFAKMILKTILIKHIIEFRKKAYLSNIFIIDDRVLFSYPLNNVNNKFLDNFRLFNCSTTPYSASVKCAMDKLNTFSSTTTSYGNYIFTYTTVQLNLLTCMKNTLKLFTSNHFYICLEHQLSEDIKKINTPGRNMEIASFVVINPDVMILLSSHIDPNKYPEYYDVQYLSQKYYKMEKGILLFHILYDEIFKNAKALLTQDIVKAIETEYDLIVKEVIKAHDEISNKKNNKAEVSFTMSQSFLDYNYDISGILAPSQGVLDVGQYLYVIKPVVNNNYQYDNNFNHDGKTDMKYDLIYNIVIYKLIIERINKRLFGIWVYKCVATWTFSTFLLLVYQWPFYIFFNCVLNWIFEPIREIDQKMEMKVSTILSISKDNHDKDTERTKLNIEGKDKLNEDYKKFCQFFYFLENLSWIKMNLKTVLIDEGIMNQVFPSINSNKDKIIYGSYIAEYFFKNSMFEKCRSTIKNFKTAIDDEMMRLKEETDNIEMEVHNIVSSKPYINDFSDLNKIFNGESQSSNREYFMICATASKLYYIYGVCKLKIAYKKMKNDKEALLKEKEKEREREKEREKDKENYKEYYRDKAKEKDSKMSVEIAKPKLFDKNKSILHYFDKSMELSEKLNCNKIKRIIILIHIVKYYILQGNNVDAFINIREAFTFFLELNDKFKAISKQISFDPMIMMIINSSIFEELIYLTGKIKVKGIDFNEMTMKNLSTSLALSFFKTDFIQGKTCKLLSIMMDKSIKLKEKVIQRRTHRNEEKKKELDKRKKQQKFLSKVYERLKTSSEGKHIKKRFVLIFSESFIKYLPSKIEFIEVLGTCIANHCNNDDIIRTYQFNQDFSDESKIWTTTTKYFSKDRLAEVMNKEREPIPYGMYESLNKAFEYLNNTADSLSNTSSDYDDYIFQFILTKDFKFKYPSDRANIRDGLNDNDSILSLYSFIFDYHLASEKKKYKIISNISKYAEGVLVNMKNFDVMKFAFQNISNKQSKTNLLNFNSNLVDDIYYFNNKTKEDLENELRKNNEED